MPAEWVRGPLKEAHWRVLTTARALENTIYVAAADHAPPIGAGNSMIVDPMGVEVATIGESTDVAIAWVSRERIDAVRRDQPRARAASVRRDRARQRFALSSASRARPPTPPRARRSRLQNANRTRLR